VALVKKILITSYHSLGNVPMNSTTFKAKYVAEGDTCPLRIFHAAIATLVIARYGLDNGVILGSHLNHLDGRFLVDKVTSIL
jgi:hypothetical protein